MWHAVFTMNATLVCIYVISALIVEEVLHYLMSICFYVILIYMSNTLTTKQYILIVLCFFLIII